MLFYSNRCTHSRTILQTLETMNKSSLVNAVCVDNVPRHQLPPFLKSVPTLYVPETKDILVGQAIYGYIAKPVSARQERPTGAAPGIAKQGPPQGSGEPDAWGALGGGGLTDAYSSWSNPSQFVDTDQRNYSFLGAVSAALGGADAPPTKNIQQRSGDGGKDDIQSRLEAMQQAREKEFTPIRRQ